ncbi:MAG: efflux RND transporter periplasmic adaptor subunit [Thermoanaerobaculia bacterium]
MEKRRTPLRWAVTILVLGIIFVLGWKAFAGRKNKSEEAYRSFAADRGTVTMTVTATGTLSAVTTVQVGSQVSGVISRLYADFNSPVKKGQLIAELDPTPFQAQVEQRRADAERSEVEVRNSQITYQRQKRLVDQGLTAQADLDTAKAAYDAARAQLDMSRAALRQAETNLQYTRILSPIDGVVAARQYDVGQTVAASFQAPTLFTIAQDLTKMQVQADVDQSDIGRVRVGQTARFTVDAYPEETFQGKISQIRLNATTNQNVVTYPVIIQVPNPDKRLRPQMTANVTIDVASVPNVLRVPNAALRFRPDPDATGRKSGNGPETGPSTSFERSVATSGEGGGIGAMGAAVGGRRHDRHMQTVYVLGPNDALRPVKIRTGISDGRFTAVVDGELKPGDKVVVGKVTAKAEEGRRGPRMGRF